MPAGLAITFISAYYTPHLPPPPPPHMPLTYSLSADIKLTGLYLLLHMVMHNDV